MWCKNLFEFAPFDELELEWVIQKVLQNSVKAMPTIFQPFL